eukprot:COSAG01_NODE_2309_length_7942_cov_7.425602_3_plen_231_part_00
MPSAGATTEPRPAGRRHYAGRNAHVIDTAYEQATYFFQISPRVRLSWYEYAAISGIEILPCSVETSQGTLDAVRRAHAGFGSAHTQHEPRCMHDVRGRRARAAGRGQANGATLRADKIAGAYENILTSRESHFGAPACSACTPQLCDCGAVRAGVLSLAALFGLSAISTLMARAMSVHTVAGAALAPLPQPELHAVSGACPSLKLRSPVWLRASDQCHACSCLEIEDGNA